MKLPRQQTRVMQECAGHESLLVLVLVGDLAVGVAPQLVPVLVDALHHVVIHLLGQSDWSGHIGRLAGLATCADLTSTSSAAAHCVRADAHGKGHVHGRTRRQTSCAHLILHAVEEGGVACHIAETRLHEIIAWPLHQAPVPMLSDFAQRTARNRR